MERIYLDNAATSFPKAPDICKAMSNFLENDCLNHNRTESERAFSLFEQIYSLRKTLASFYGHDRPEDVIFTRSITESLNWIIKGVLCGNSSKEPGHIIVTSSEHNAVMRPLVQCKIPFSRIPATSEGYSKLDEVEKLIKPNTKAMIINACGNVSGHVEDVQELANIAKKHNLLFFVDSAQTSPFIDLKMNSLNASGICFTAHKGFLGPEGVGGMVLRHDIALSMEPLIAGGTGSESDSEEIPHSLPDRLEPGTLNLPGILGFAKAVDFTLSNLEKLKSQTNSVTEHLYNGLSSIDGIEIVGTKLDSAKLNNSELNSSELNNSGLNNLELNSSKLNGSNKKKRTNVISIVSSRKDISYISAQLLEKCGIETRVGLHCSPASHKAIGTFPNGTLRFSPGPFTTQEEIDTTLECLKEILSE